MSRMAIRLRTATFAMLLGLGASNAFAQGPAEFIEQASAKGMADIETSRMAHVECPPSGGSLRVPVWPFCDTAPAAPLKYRVKFPRRLCCCRWGCNKRR